jgi:co-chaperonin GroES (HSP10)
MRVLNKYLLAERVSEQKQTKSGLLLTGEDSSDMRYHKARVFDVGVQVSGIQYGDVIMYDKVNSHDVLINETRYVILQEKDVVVVL